MRGSLQFPVHTITENTRQLAVTFETLAVPPPHELVSTVLAWIFHGEELLIVRPRGRSWELPRGERLRGATFRETLDRVLRESTGVLLDSARMIGALRISQSGEPEAEPAASGVSNFIPCFIAEARELVPFDETFAAEDRLRIEPGLAARCVDDWSPLMDELLQYIQAVRAPERVEALAGVG